MTAKRLLSALLALLTVGSAAPAFAEKQWAVTLLGGQYSGSKLLVEFASTINARWITFPWNRYLETSVAIGGGLSVTSEVPVLEKRDPNNSDAATLRIRYRF